MKPETNRTRTMKGHWDTHTRRHSVLETSFRLNIFKDLSQFIIFKSAFQTEREKNEMSTTTKIRNQLRERSEVSSLDIGILIRQDFFSSNIYFHNHLGMSDLDSSELSGHRLAKAASSNLCNFFCMSKLRKVKSTKHQKSNNKTIIELLSCITKSKNLLNRSVACLSSQPTE